MEGSFSRYRLSVRPLITGKRKFLAGHDTKTCCVTPAGGGHAPFEIRCSRFAPDTPLSSGCDVHSSHAQTYNVTRPCTGPTQCFIIHFACLGRRHSCFAIVLAVTSVKWRGGFEKGPFT